MGFLSLLFVLVALTALGNAETDKTAAAMDMVQLTQCKKGYSGEHMKDYHKAVSDCKNEHIKKKGSDSCHTLCIWEAANYLQKDGSGSFTGLNKAGMEKISKEFYNDPESVKANINDIQTCYDSVNPKHSFKNAGACEEFEPIHKCYKDKLLDGCLAYLKTLDD